MIRPATLADVNAIFDIVMVETKKYPKLLPDRDKIRNGIIQAISSAKHFAWVSGNGKVSGALIGLTSANLWAQRSNCIIVLWKSAIVGDGIKMMRAFKYWLQFRRAIRVAGIVPDTDELNPRGLLLAQCLGFRRYGGAYLLYN